MPTPSIIWTAPSSRRLCSWRATPATRRRTTSRLWTRTQRLLCSAGHYLDGDGTCWPHTLDGITPTTTKGDLLVEDGASAVRLPVGADGMFLTADSTAASGVDWKARPHREATWATAVGPNDQTDSGQISSRTLTFFKEAADTALRISYTDNFRVVGPAATCRWEIRVDGNSCPGVNGELVYDYYSSSANNRHQSHTVGGFCTGLAAGPHEVQVWVGPTPGHWGGDCYTGWNHSTWVLEAEEVRQAAAPGGS